MVPVATAVVLASLTAAALALALRALLVASSAWTLPPAAPERIHDGVTMGALPDRDRRPRQQQPIRGTPALRTAPASLSLRRRGGDLHRGATTEQGDAGGWSLDASCRGKERLLGILSSAGHPALNGGGGDWNGSHRESLSNLCSALPFWSNVTDLYGTVAIVHGLDTCESYRSGLLPTKEAALPRVTGLFHTGTNALARAFLEHFGGDGGGGSGSGTEGGASEERHRLWDVPWGKHRRPPRFLRRNGTRWDGHVLPVVLVRDPFRWMRKMVRWSGGCDRLRVPQSRVTNGLSSYGC
jgi:hypothetical protein